MITQTSSLSQCNYHYDNNVLRFQKEKNYKKNNIQKFKKNYDNSCIEVKDQKLEDKNSN